MDDQQDLSFYRETVACWSVAVLGVRPGGRRIWHDSPVKAHLDVALKVVKADQAFVNSGGLDGRGVGVAVVDTGVALHRDLMRAKSSQVIEVEVVGHEAGLADYFGHGTHVAGIIGGNGAASSDKLSFRTFK